MNRQKVVSDRYAGLCQELGHLQANKLKIEKRIKEIETEVAALDSVSALLNAAEAQEMEQAKKADAP
jgi:cell division septum initiation protein DivIVA